MRHDPDVRRERLGQLYGSAPASQHRRQPVEGGPCVTYGRGWKRSPRGYAGNAKHPIWHQRVPRLFKECIGLIGPKEIEHVTRNDAVEPLAVKDSLRITVILENANAWTKSGGPLPRQCNHLWADVTSDIGGFGRQDCFKQAGSQAPGPATEFKNRGGCVEMAFPDQYIQRRLLVEGLGVLKRSDTIIDAARGRAREIPHPESIACQAGLHQQRSPDTGAYPTLYCSRDRMARVTRAFSGPLSGVRQCPSRSVNEQQCLLLWGATENSQPGRMTANRPSCSSPF